MTEVLDFLRLLWARLGQPVCPECGAAIESECRASRLLRIPLLSTFALTTYIIAPVVGFAWLLLIMGFAQTRPSERLERAICLVLIPIVEFCVVPWRQFVPS